MELVHVSVRTPVGVFLTNPDGRVWSRGPGLSGYVVFSVPHMQGMWRLNTVDGYHVVGPGRSEGSGVWFTLTGDLLIGWLVVQDQPPEPPAPPPHDPLADISVPPAEEGHVWVLLVLERRDGHRSVPVRVQVAVADLVEFLEGVT